MKRATVIILALLWIGCGGESSTDPNQPVTDTGTPPIDGTFSPGDTLPPPDVSAQGDTTPQTDTASEDTSLTPGCCMSDADCSSDAFCLGATDTPGVCAADLVDDDCYFDSDCDEGGTCIMASICPCGVVCVQGTEPGGCKYDDPLPEDCCANDKDCQDDSVCAVPDSDSNGECVDGFSADNECYNNSHCDTAAGETCEGQILCPCGETCFAPSSPGTCTGGTGPDLGDVGACCGAGGMQYPDCKPGLVCLIPLASSLGACALPAPDGGGCYSDGDCTEGTCVGGMICNCDMNCVSLVGNCKKTPPEPDCCTLDTDCNPNEQCASTSTGGVCKPIPPGGQCWDDSQCDGTAGSCQNLILCPCGATCAKPDKPGSCKNVTPPGADCCTVPTDCTPGESCVLTATGGVCKLPPANGGCWDDTDCIDTAGTCENAVLCPCGASCAKPDQPGTCKSGIVPGPECCVDSSECGIQMLCVETSAGGVCMTPPKAGQCWSDDDCGGDVGSCMGASVCPCGAQCFAPDTPGVCKDFQPPSDCCATDSDCNVMGGGSCAVGDGMVNGMCMATLKFGDCYNDSHCDGGVCNNAILCACDVLCAAGNIAGTCGPPVFLPPGCCDDDGDCDNGETCVVDDQPFLPPGSPVGGQGVCKPKAPVGSCWSAADCAMDEICDGQTICPCGAFCIGVPDSPGTCVKSGGPDPGGGLCCDLDKDCLSGEQCVVPFDMFPPTPGAPIPGQSGVCKTKPVAGDCWSDADCGGMIGSCIGSTVCPCNSFCFMPDMPGTCAGTGPGGGSGAIGDCCSVDTECSSGTCAVDNTGGQGTCAVNLEFMTECYNDSHCMGGKCTGAITCPCGVLCKTGNIPGICGPPTF